MSVIYDGFKRETDKKIKNLEHIKTKLKRLVHYDEYNDWRRIRTACYEIDEEIKKTNLLVTMFKTSFDDFGMFTREYSDRYLRVFNAAVIYFELFYERAARWDKSSFNYSRCLDYEKALLKRCPPSDNSHLNLFKEVAATEPDAEKIVLKAEADFVKWELEARSPSGNPDTSLPYPI